MTTKPIAILALALTLSACSSPPKAPTVDDSKKRPVNVSEAVNLQMCRAELSAAKVVLTETLTESQRQIATAVRQADVSSAQVVALPNQVFVIHFALGSAEFNLAADQQAKLIEQARNAKFIVIRGRTDAPADSLSETRLAQRRTEAAYNYLMRSVKLPTSGIRLSWQGAGDRAAAGEGGAERQANRRVEIELYQAKPEFESLSALAS